MHQQHDNICDAPVDDLLNGEPQPVPDPDVPERFTVHDEATANWVVRRIVEARSYAEHVKEWAELEVLRAQREEEFFLRRFGEELRKWTAARLKKLKSKNKSIKLPAGCVGFRKSPHKIVVQNEELVISWARHSCPSAVTMVPKLSKTAINEHFESTGELPSQGVIVQPAAEKFYVK